MVSLPVNISHSLLLCNARSGWRHKSYRDDPRLPPDGFVASQGKRFPDDGSASARPRNEVQHRGRIFSFKLYRPHQWHTIFVIGLMIHWDPSVANFVLFLGEGYFAVVSGVLLIQTNIFIMPKNF